MEGRRMRRKHVLALCWTTGVVAALGLLAFFSGLSRLSDRKADLSDGPEFRSRKLLELHHLPVQESILAEVPTQGVALQEIPNPFPPFQYPPPAAPPPPPARPPPPPVAAAPPTSPSPPRSPPPPATSQSQNRPPPPSQSSSIGAGIAPGQSASSANSPRAAPGGVFRNNHAAAAAIGGGLAVVVLAVVILAIWKGKDSGERRHDNRRWNK